MLNLSKRTSNFEYSIFVFNVKKDQYEQYDCTDMQECEETLKILTDENVTAFICASHVSMDNKIASVMLDEDYGFHA